MAADLFQTNAPDKLAIHIAQKMAADGRSLPPRAKVFAAVAKMQGFDAFPTLASPTDFQALVSAGKHIELNRGLCATNGILAFNYAREFVFGQLYPGTQSAFGTGIYFADLGCPIIPKTPIAGFPAIAKTAFEHAGAGANGVILRCLLKPEARILTHDEVKELRRENKNRYREAQLADCGSLTAALGCDGFSCDGTGANHGERWYVIVNRTALIIQGTCVNHSQVTI